MIIIIQEKILPVNRGILNFLRIWLQVGTRGNAQEKAVDSASYRENVRPRRILVDADMPSTTSRKCANGNRSLTPLGDKLFPLNCLLQMASCGEKPVRNTESLLRIIQSIPSPKAEPFKHWLAKVGCERHEKIDNPGLAAKRMRCHSSLTYIENF